MKRQQTQAEKTKKRKVLIIILLVFLALIILLLISKCCFIDTMLNAHEYLHRYLDDDGTSLDGMKEVTDNETLLSELEKQQVMVTDKLSSNITFTSGDIGSIGEWIVENLEENQIIQHVEVYLGDVLIAKSTPIYPNQYISEY